MSTFFFFAMEHPCAIRDRVSLNCPQAKFLQLFPNNTNIYENYESFPTTPYSYKNRHNEVSSSRCKHGIAVMSGLATLKIRSFYFGLRSLLLLLAWLAISQGSSQISRNISDTGSDIGMSLVINHPVNDHVWGNKSVL